MPLRKSRSSPLDRSSWCAGPRDAIGTERQLSVDNALLGRPRPAQALPMSWCDGAQLSAIGPTRLGQREIHSPSTTSCQATGCPPRTADASRTRCKRWRANSTLVPRRRALLNCSTRTSSSSSTPTDPHKEQLGRRHQPRRRGGGRSASPRSLGTRGADRAAPRAACRARDPACPSSRTWGPLVPRSSCPLVLVPVRAPARPSVPPSPVHVCDAVACACVSVQVEGRPNLRRQTRRSTQR